MKTINNAEFADYIRSVQTGGSYAISQEVSSSLEVKGSKVTGPEWAIDSAYDTFLWILENL